MRYREGVAHSSSMSNIHRVAAHIPSPLYCATSAASQSEAQTLSKSWNCEKKRRRADDKERNINNNTIHPLCVIFFLNIFFNNFLHKFSELTLTCVVDSIISRRIRNVHSMDGNCFGWRSLFCVCWCWCSLPKDGIWGGEKKGRLESRKKKNCGRKIEVWADLIDDNCEWKA